MKKVLFLLLVIIGTETAHAQFFSKEKLKNIENFDKQRWSYGYFLGFNNYDFKFDYNEKQLRDIEVQKSFGFNVGLIGDLRINEYINLRLEPGVLFVTRKLNFENAVPEEAYSGSLERNVKSTYIHVPLLVKFSTKRLNNFKPFVEAGVSTSWNLSSNENAKEDNYSNKFRMKTNTYYWEVGLGVDLYLFYFKFTPSIRGVFAMSNELVPDNDPDSAFTGGVDKMMTRGVFLNFKFQ